MTVLAWREATADDKEALKQFECTRREKRRGRTVYPRPWERAAETAVRTVNPRPGPKSALLLGIDEEGIGAVAGTNYDPNYPAYMVEMIAIAERWRSRGGVVADEAMDEAVQWCLARLFAEGDRAPFVIADTDPRNEPAKALLSRQHFRRVAVDESRELWLYDPGALPFIEPV